VAMTGVMLADFSAFRKEADSSAASLKQLETGGDNVASKLSKIGESVNLKQALTDPMGAATSATEGLVTSLGGAVGVSAAAAGGLIALGTAAFGLASKAADTVAVFDDLHDKTDLSVPALSRLSNAAQVIGGDMGTLTNVIFKLQQGIGENTDAFQKGLSQMGLSTQELKAAGPDQYLDLVVKGLQSIPDASTRAAAGTAVMGKQYREVAATLNDLATGLQMTADITPFTAQEAADAEAFTFQIASLKTHVSEAATELGVALIPAVSATISGLERMGLAVVHVAELGGLLPAAWKGIKDSLGEADLAQQTMLANTEMVNRLFMEQGATAESVAAKLLDLGFSQQNVATLTGLSADAVRKLNGELEATKDATASYEAAMGRVNTQLAAGPPNIDAVDAATRGWVVDMKAANISLKDMETASGLTAAQINKITKEAEAAGTATKAWQEAVDRVNAAGVGWQTTLDTIDGAVVESVKYSLSLGAALSDLQKEYGITDKQAQAIKISLEEYATTINATADMERAAGEQRKRITQETLDQSNQKVIAALNEQKAQEGFLANNLKEAQAQDAIQQAIGRTTAAVTEHAGAVVSSSAQETGAVDTTTQAYYRKLDAITKASLAANEASGVGPTGTVVGHRPGEPGSELFAGAAIPNEGYPSWWSAPGGAAGAMKGNTIEERMQALQDEMARYGGIPVNISNMFANLHAFGEGGSGDFGTGTPVMLHGREAVVPLDDVSEGSNVVYGGEAGVLRGGASSGPIINLTVNVTQPLGTADAIARAVADAQIAAYKSQGVRLPYA
jgi:hypothetical protein